MIFYLSIPKPISTDSATDGCLYSEYEYEYDYEVAHIDEEAVEQGEVDVHQLEAIDFEERIKEKYTITETNLRYYRIDSDDTFYFTIDEIKTKGDILVIDGYDHHQNGIVFVNGEILTYFILNEILSDLMKMGVHVALLGCHGESVLNNGADVPRVLGTQYLCFPNCRQYRRIKRSEAGKIIGVSHEALRFIVDNWKITV